MGGITSHKIMMTFTTKTTAQVDTGNLLFTDIVRHGGTLKYITDNDVYGKGALKAYLDCQHDGFSMIIPVNGWNVSLILQHDDNAVITWIFGLADPVKFYVKSLNSCD